MESGGGFGEIGEAMSQENIGAYNEQAGARQRLNLARGTGSRYVGDLGGASVGVVEGSVAEDYVRAEAPAARIRSYPNGFQAVQPVRVGLIEAAVLDQALAEDEVEPGSAAASNYAMRVRRVPGSVHIASTFSP